MTNYQTIAVLMTCHNRRKKTLNCLESLYNNLFPDDIRLDVFLVDDGSTDGTGVSVKQRFPHVQVIQGNGHLYWNQGMRLAWKTAVQKKKYDFYLWLNDDTLLDNDAISELLSCYNEVKKIENKESVIVGTCRNDFDSDEFSYGGRINDNPVIPDGSIQKCNYINGNVVLISQAIYKKIGNLSLHYTHAIGDTDYGLRAINTGFDCYITKKYMATCAANELADWCNPEVPIAKRLKNLNSPKGLNIKEYVHFLKEHKKNKWVVLTVKVYVKTFFPRLYAQLSKQF